MMMRNTMLTLSLLLGSLSASAQSFTVQGNVTGLSDGDTLQLQEISHVMKPTPLAQTVVSGGKFTFEGQLDEPRGVLLIKKGTVGGFQLIVFNEKATLTGSYQEERTDNGNYATWKVKVDGSELTDQMNEKLKVRDALDALYNENQKRNEGISSQLADARQKKDSALMKRLEQTAEYKRMAADEAHFFQTVDSTYRALFRANSDSWWGPFLMECCMSYLTPEDSDLYQMLTPAARDTYYGRMVRDEVMPASQVGKAMPLFTVTEGEHGNEPLALKDVLSKSRYTIVDFWASWCVPCRREIPNLKKLYATYHDKGLDIVSVSIDRNVQQWKKACQQEQLPWHSYRDTTGVDALYKVEFIPSMFILDQQGRLVASGLKGQELADQLAKLFSK